MTSGAMAAPPLTPPTVTAWSTAITKVLVSASIGAHVVAKIRFHLAEVWLERSVINY